MVPALGELADLGAKTRLRRGRGFVHAGAQRVRAVAVDELDHAVAPDLERRGLRAQVAHGDVGQPDVAGDEVEQALVELAPLEELDRRDAQPLLVDLHRITGVAPRAHAADVEVVSQRAADGDERPAMEDRQEGLDVGEVLAALVGVVGDDDVAFFPLCDGNRLVQCGAQRAAHRVQMDGDAARLRDDSPIEVEDRGGVVEHLPDDGGVGGAENRRRHLLGDTHQRVVHDLEGHGIDSHRSQSPVEIIGLRPMVAATGSGTPGNASFTTSKVTGSTRITLILQSRSSGCRRRRPPRAVPGGRRWWCPSARPRPGR